ncbi:MAG TPA: hypothetical protein VIG03_06370 [Steroidobacteraceae bacterium]|jgi:hypothetical protein
MFRKIALALVLASAAAPALAGTPRLNSREHNQRDRIAQGLHSGELTRPEARRLVHGEIGLHRAERYAKADGVVTRAERCRLERNADRMSGRIYRQKHDSQSR